ncbi:uncharacterized protein LOC108667188 [Hyalella azteca]|uniref:Uncharacterized protein LOC108667188 n=1 Tax=Hyalella azteca TaxID=294128 RepID=A0A8B7N7R1_HYAAZ|nr:uncharacterized protein LOC108667188 [Hyalella azteca]
MGDIFSGMFFCNRAPMELPEKRERVFQRTKSQSEQDLTEYLKAYRNKETVDEEWRKVHEKRGEKKRFQKLVNKQMIVSKMQLVGDGEIKRRSSIGSIAETIPLKENAVENIPITMEEERKLEAIARENEAKKEKREQYLRQIRGQTGGSDQPLSAQSKRRVKKWKTVDKADEPANDSEDGKVHEDLEDTLRSLENVMLIKNAIKEEEEDEERNDRENERNSAHADVEPIEMQENDT